jgi:hypothetical protein
MTLVKLIGSSNMNCYQPILSRAWSPYYKCSGIALQSILPCLIELLLAGLRQSSFFPKGLQGASVWLWSSLFSTFEKCISKMLKKIEIYIHVGNDIYFNYA